MSDYSKLKALAEALNKAIEQAEHKPGQWSGTAQSMGGICCPGEPFDIRKPSAKEEPWAHFSYKRDSWLAVAAVNALPDLIGLIAENERLESDSIQWGKAFVRIAGELSVMAMTHADMTEDAPLRQAIDFVKSAMSERDTLRAENAGLKTGYEAYEQVNAELRGEVEALCKDAERFRFVIDCPIRTMVALSRKAAEADFDLASECDRLISRRKEADHD